jgi:hypothetical protein
MKAALGRLYAAEHLLAGALEDIEAGRLSVSTHLPVRVSRLEAPRGALIVLDGHHRVIEAGLRGGTSVPVEVDSYMPRIERAGGAWKDWIQKRIPVKTFVNRTLFLRLSTGSQNRRSGGSLE